MANKENLIPMDKRSKDEVRKIAAKGGRSSGETRRQKKTIRETFAMLKDMPVSNKKIRDKLEQAGISDTDVTFGAAMAYMTIVHAMKGNPSFMRLAYEMLGENDVQGVSHIPGGITVKFDDDAKKSKGDA